MSNTDVKEKTTEPTGYELSRAQVMTEGVNGLFIINGGGAVALLGFLQAIWKQDPALARLTLIGLAFLSTGIVFAAVVNFIRIKHLHIADPNKKVEVKDYRRVKMIRDICIVCSIACFAFACLVLVSGGLRFLE